MSIKLKISGKLLYRWTHSCKKHEGLIPLTSYKIKSLDNSGVTVYTRYPIIKGLNLLEYFARYYLDGWLARQWKAVFPRYYFCFRPSLSLLFIPLNASPLIVVSHTFISLSLGPSSCLNLQNYFALLACNAHITLFINHPTGSSRNKKRTKVYHNKRWSMYSGTDAIFMQFS